MHYGRVITERVKKYAMRASAFALACFVVAFSVSAPAFAAIPPSGNASMRVILDFQDGTYLDGTASLNYPYNSVGIYTPSFTIPADKYLVSSSTWLFFDELPSGETYRLRIRYRGFINANYTDITSQYVGVHYYDGTNYYPLAFTQVSLQNSFDAMGYIYDITLQFDLPVNATVFRIVFYSYFTPYFIGGGDATGVSIVDFVGIDPVTDQTTGDKIETDRVDGSVNDKTDESDSLLGEIGSVSKPSVNVNPMQGMDLNAFRAFTNILAIPFESPYIVWMFVTMLSFSLIAYVLFGKGG